MYYEYEELLNADLKDPEIVKEVEVMKYSGVFLEEILSSDEYFNKFKDYIDWDYTSRQNILDKEMVLKYKDYLNLDLVNFNKLCLDLDLDDIDFEFIEEFKDRLDWRIIISSIDTFDARLELLEDTTIKLLEKYKDYIDWDQVSSCVKDYYYCDNIDILIDKFKDRIDGNIILKTFIGHADEKILEENVLLKYKDIIPLENLKLYLSDREAIRHIILNYKIKSIKELKDVIDWNLFTYEFIELAFSDYEYSSLNDIKTIKSIIRNFKPYFNKAILSSTVTMIINSDEWCDERPTDKIIMLLGILKDIIDWEAISKINDRFTLYLLRDGRFNKYIKMEYIDWVDLSYNFSDDDRYKKYIIEDKITIHEKMWDIIVKYNLD